MNPVSRRMGLGDWHSICSLVGLWRKSRTAIHMGLVVLLAVYKQIDPYIKELVYKYDLLLSTVKPLSKRSIKRFHLFIVN